MCSDTIYSAIQNGTGFFQHGHTYLSHPTACAAGLAVLTKLTTGLVDTVADKGEYLRSRLQDRFGQHQHVGDIRGRGLFVGMEFVQDRESKTCLDPTLKFHSALKSAAFAEGLICYPMGGTIDGRQGDHVLLAPPFISHQEHLDELVDKLGTAFDKAMQNVGLR